MDAEHERPRLLWVRCDHILAACGSPAGANHDACDFDTQISIGSGLTPSVTWSPNCLAKDFAIDSAPDTTSREAHFVWWLDSSPDGTGEPVNRIGSPLDYSSRPDQVMVRVAPHPLVPGVQYRVSIDAYDDAGRVTVSSKLFVR